MDVLYRHSAMFHSGFCLFCARAGMKRSGMTDSSLQACGRKSGSLTRKMVNFRQSFAERQKPPAVYLGTAWHLRLLCHRQPMPLRLFLLKVQSFCVEYDRGVMFLV